MTVDELLAREAIRATLANYTSAGDRLKTEEFIAVFTEDGILETEGVPPEDTFRCNGRAEIRTWMTRWRPSADAAPVHRATFIRHHLATCQIDFTGTSTAKVRTYWVAYTDIGPDHGGYYVDDFRKQDELWLIAHRRIRLDWRRDESLHQGSIERTRLDAPEASRKKRE